MDNLMSQRIGDGVPLVTQPMIDYLRGKRACPFYPLYAKNQRRSGTPDRLFHASIRRAAPPQRMI